jgi:hypothetical protein
MPGAASPLSSTRICGVRLPEDTDRWHVPKAPPRAPVNRAPAPPHRAAIWQHQAEQGTHKCGLASAVRAQQPNQMTGRDPQAAAIQR